MAQQASIARPVKPTPPHGADPVEYSIRVAQMAVYAAGHRSRNPTHPTS